jgi:hypothetical protein
MRQIVAPAPNASWLGYVASVFDDIPRTLRRPRPTTCVSALLATVSQTYPRRLRLALSTALALLVLACAGSSSEGIVVTLRTDPAKVPPATTFDTDLGYRVVVSKAYVNLSTVEIFGCDAPLASSFSERAERGLRDVFTLERHAFAHTEGSPTKLGAPIVEAFTGSGAGATVGELRPPAGRYCRVVQSLQAADGDARDLPTDVPMVGKSMYVAGTYAKGGQAPVPFEAESTASFDASKDLAFELSTTGTKSVTVVLTRDTTHWFDGIDFATLGKRDVAKRIVDAMAESYGARLD